MSGLLSFSPGNYSDTTLQFTLGVDSHGMGNMPVVGYPRLRAKRIADDHNAP